jgi:glycosyltransferase involved in cell wall biosynthesis
MKKIVILSAFLSPLRSGAEACAEEVPLALADQYYFTIVTARMRRDLPKKGLLQDKIPVIRVGFGCTFDKWLFPFLAPLAVRKIKPDVVHAILETFAGLALVFCKAPKKILTCQTTNRSFLKGFIVRSAHQVTCISRALAETIQDLKCKSVLLISNGINASELADARLKYDRIPGSVLFVGRLESMKGIDTLLQAVAKIPGAHLRIAGDGSQKKLLLKITTELGISDRVEFLGYIPSDALAVHYAQAEVFCGLSRSEALGNVFLEAQAAGCAVIGTSVGGIPDIIEHEKTGLIVPPDDVQAATKAITRVMEDADLRNRLQETGAAHAQAFDWQVIAAEYAKLY